MLCWKSNLGRQIECLPDLLKSKIDTEYYQTTTANADFPAHTGKQKENKNGANKLTTAANVKKQAAKPASKVVNALQDINENVSLLLHLDAQRAELQRLAA